MSDEPTSQKTWGGRFRGQTSDLMTKINASISFDKRLWREDIEASKAHAAMLGVQGIVSADDAAAILGGLDQIVEEFERDGVPERVELEDIHMTVEHRLTELIGPAAGGYTRRARATTKLRRTSSCGFAGDAMKPSTPFGNFKGR